MMIPVSSQRGVETLVGLVHVMAVVECGTDRQVRLLPGTFGRGDTIRVDDLLSEFDGLPGLMAVRLISPHTDPRPALVNVALVAMAKGCTEGTLLHFSGGTDTKLLVDVRPGEIMDFCGRLPVVPDLG